VPVGVAVSATDEFLASVDYAEEVEAHVAAPPARAFEAALAVTVNEMRLSALLMTLRGLPGVILQRRLPRWGSTGAFWEQLLREPGFTALREADDGYAALGYVGRPWKPTGEGRNVPAEEFAAFDEPGWAKVVMDLSANPAPQGSLLRTETRIHLTDAQARRAFARYWLVVRFGSNAIRRDWLRAARRRAAARASRDGGSSPPSRRAARPSRPR
jgi:hypothetical protein